MLGVRWMRKTLLSQQLEKIILVFLVSGVVLRALLCRSFVDSWIPIVSEWLIKDRPYSVASLCESGELVRIRFAAFCEIGCGVFVGCLATSLVIRGTLREARKED